MCVRACVCAPSPRCADAARRDERSAQWLTCGRPYRMMSSGTRWPTGRDKEDSTPRGCMLAVIRAPLHIQLRVSAGSVLPPAKQMAKTSCSQSTGRGKEGGSGLAPSLPPSSLKISNVQHFKHWGRSPKERNCISGPRPRP